MIQVDKLLEYILEKGPVVFRTLWDKLRKKEKYIIINEGEYELLRTLD